MKLKKWKILEIHTLIIRNVVNKKNMNPSKAHKRFTTGTMYLTGGLPKIVSGCPLISIKAVQNPLK